MYNLSETSILLFDKDFTFKTFSHFEYPNNNFILIGGLVNIEFNVED